MEKINVYQVIVDGNHLIKEFVNLKPARRKCVSLSKNRNKYVELWYIHGDGSRILVEYWN